MPEFRISELGTPAAQRYFAACESPIPLTEQARAHLDLTCPCQWSAFPDTKPQSVGITRRHPACTTHPTPPAESEPPVA